MTCPHDYGEQQGPCPICDAGDLLAIRAVLYNFAKWVVAVPIPRPLPEGMDLAATLVEAFEEKVRSDAANP